MTVPRRWPNNAEDARIDSIALCEKAVGILKESCDRDLSDMDILRRLIKVVDLLRQTQAILRSVGPRAPIG